jgi:DNA-binding XRE family transcriptional regulator
VIRDSREKAGLTEGQLAHRAKTNVQALALLEMGVMAELDTLVARMNRVLAPLGYNVEPVFRLFNNGLDYGRAKDTGEGL